MAVNTLLDRAGAMARRASVFPLTEDTGPLVKLAKDLDRRRWQADRRSESFVPAGLRGGSGGQMLTMDEALDIERTVMEALQRASV
jgi:hypothetical protein